MADCDIDPEVETLFVCDNDVVEEREGERDGDGLPLWDRDIDVETAPDKEAD